jgi:hypothetical protein
MVSHRGRTSQAAERRDPVVSVDLIKKCGHFGLGRFELGPAGIIYSKGIKPPGCLFNFDYDQTSVHENVKKLSPWVLNN